MANAELRRLLGELVAAQQEAAAFAATLTNAQLDLPSTVGGREVPLRNVLYQLVVHPREHLVHLQKLLQETGAPGARPTEAQLIVAEASQSLGAFLGLFARMSDDDVDREFEGHTPRTVVEHLTNVHKVYLQRMRQAVGAE